MTMMMGILLLAIGMIKKAKVFVLNEQYTLFPRTSMERQYNHVVYISIWQQFTDNDNNIGYSNGAFSIK